jgi:indolepyruvate ferredoxin oxidoreductase alpha subunit
MLGNEAVARGLFEAGVAVISSYPGTPSTEITEYASEYAEMYSEWAPNEKVALEVALGASIAGARAFSAMKHVGLNVAGRSSLHRFLHRVNGGLVIAVADDPGMHSSQNEQDSRNHAKGAKVPMLEPSDSAECLAFTKYAFELSEEYDTPVLVRLTTRVSHSQSLVETGERRAGTKKEYKKDPAKFLMLPANARGRHVVVEKRMAALTELASRTPLNRIERGSSKIGVITSGVAYEYAREALGENASYLKLGLVNPLPVGLIKEFAASWTGSRDRGTGRFHRKPLQIARVEVTARRSSPSSGSTAP